MSEQPPQCQNCGTLAQLAEDGRSLTVVFRCVKCKTVRYCDTGCQREDYPRHKQECRELAAAREEKKQQVRMARREARRVRKQQEQQEQQGQQGQQSESTIKDDDPPQKEDDPPPSSSVAKEERNTVKGTASEPVSAGETKSYEGVSDQEFEKVITACGKGQMKKLKQFLKKHKGQINRTNGHGATLLYAACYNCQMKAIKLLLKQDGVQLNRARNSGATPLIVASKNGHSKVVRLLFVEEWY